jgi:hypothetical protein
MVHLLFGFFLMLLQDYHIYNKFLGELGLSLGKMFSSKY